MEVQEGFDPLEIDDPLHFESHLDLVPHRMQIHVACFGLGLDPHEESHHVVLSGVPQSYHEGGH